MIGRNRFDKAGVPRRIGYFHTLWTRLAGQYNRTRAVLEQTHQTMVLCQTMVCAKLQLDQLILRAVNGGAGLSQRGAPAPAPVESCAHAPLSWLPSAALPAAAKKVSVRCTKEYTKGNAQERGSESICSVAADQSNTGANVFTG
jgi:hypothetical protein